MPDCNHNTDPHKLVREGTSQEQRPFSALDPAYAPVNEQAPAHSMVFAQGYAAYLRYFDVGDVPVDDWQRFFSQDVSVQLAIAAVQEVDFYKTRVLESFRFLNDRDNLNSPDLKKHLGYLFAFVGTLARQLDALKETLPPEMGLKTTLQNLIQTQLAAGFGRLISYYEGGKAGTGLDLIDETDVPFLRMSILGNAVVPFSSIVTQGLSKDWHIGSPNWAAYVAGLTADPVANQSVYGSGTSEFERINHAATHNLLTSVFDQFLKVYARTVAEAKKSLESTFTNWDSHEPHYALFLAFLRLFEHARTEMNTLTGRHLDFYYKDILQLREKPAQPGHAHLLVELAKHATAHELKTGTLFKAGKDALGNDAFFANDRDVVPNQAKVAALKTVYRHGAELVGTGGNADKQVGRLYASPVANSNDGLGEELTTTDRSWHPFYNKTYDDGLLEGIKMPTAEVGFAVASHHLYLTEGYRRITIEFELQQPAFAGAFPLSASFTTEKGWHTIEGTTMIGGITFQPGPFGISLPQLVLATSAVFSFILDADAPAILPYSPKVHGGNFDTQLPMVKIVLKHEDGTHFRSAALEAMAIKNCTVTVSSGLDANGNLAAQPGLKNLAVNTDFGPVDLSKPFLPFGPAPQAGAALVIGHKEVFQKLNVKMRLKVGWKATLTSPPTATLRSLSKGNWDAASSPYSLPTGLFAYDLPSDDSARAPIDFTPNEIYTAEKTAGYLKFSADSDFGHKAWQEALTKHLLGVVKGTIVPPDTALPQPPVTPEIESVNLCYSAKSSPIHLSSGNKDPFGAKFFHLAPFGHAERHHSLGSEVTLFPQFQHTANVPHEAEFYIGITGLKPPQNLALLFQVAEGTADPLSQKPVPHLHWSYLRGNTWTAFEKDAVEDGTGELTRSGIVTLAMPRDAASDNTLLPAGMHWIRIAVETESDTVCRLLTVAAQALRATFTHRDNDPAFSAEPLPAGTIAKLDQPDAAVKKLDQPFATFGGRGQEAPNAYYTRVSERLRHKERAIALWDYERLVLEAFPQIYKVKCLNHTHYEPNQSGTGIYRELAAGHVTIVTIPNQQFQNLRDPLRPYTSLGLLLEIEGFLRQRLSCFAQLHVKNPQFEEVQINFRVRFHTGFDETYYTKQLKREITRFLSPWAFPGGGSPSFGGKIYKSVLINFVEERPFVDYVTNVQLFHIIGGKPSTIDLNEVEGSTAVSVLVSVPEEKHGILTITAAAELAQTTGDPCPCQT